MVTSIKNLIRLYFIVLITAVLGASPLFAAENDEICQYPEIESVFMDYVQTIDQVQVETMQDQLNSGGYGPVGVDGVLGEKTRQALQKVCMEFSITATDDLASKIVQMLEINTGVIQTYPQWRETIASDAFKTWLGGKTAEQQAQASQILSAGPAESILALLEEFSKTSATVQQQTPSPDLKKPVMTLDSLPADTPAVYYQWQGEKKPDEKEQAVVAIPPEILKPVGRLQGVIYANRMLFMKALKNAFTGIDVDYLPYQAQIVIEARREITATPEPIQLTGDGCGCSRDFSSVVYGFYPYWLTQPDKAQSVDFSLFNRIGFYALNLGQDGNINNALQWGEEWDSSGFIKMAHKYRVKIDLTIYTSDWRNWSDPVIDHAVNNVMENTMHDFDKSNGKYIPAFMKSSSSARADGVTIYFDDYTSSANGRNNIVKFIAKLSKRLQESGGHIKLNIMLGIDMDTIDGQSVFKDLETILLDGDASQAKVDNILILLQESTSNSKKALRRKIEDEFHGAERKAVLRKIVPVISPLGHEKDPRGTFTQFTDDLIYFQDNFAGVGFWPLPLPGDEGDSTIKEKLVTLYTSTTTSNHLGGVANTIYPELCQFACPNRWLFRIGFDLLAAILLLYALLSIWFGALRELFAKYILYFIAAIIVTMVIAMVSLVCDPFWQKRADIVLVGIIAVGIAYALWRYVDKTTQPPLP